MTTLNSIVQTVMNSHATSGPNLRSYSLADEDHDVYAVKVIDWPIHRRPAAVVVLTRVEGHWVIIEEDITDRPLDDALVAAGVAQDCIVLKYAEPASSTL